MLVATVLVLTVEDDSEVVTGLSGVLLLGDSDEDEIETAEPKVEDGTYGE